MSKVIIPDNLISHRSSWLHAMDRLIELEPESYEPDMDEKGYWKHERKAMLDMYADLDKIVPKPVISLQKFDNISKKGKFKMTTRNITKTEATPTQIEAFKARTNKKDSFERWFQKNGSI